MEENKNLTGSTDVITNIFERKSVRDYLNKEVEDDKLMTLLKAGMAAPSGKDTRPWSFVVVNQRELLDTLAHNLQNARMLSSAPVAIVVCGDSTISSYWYLDCSAATENILLAAEALELGAVWTAAYPYEDRIAVVRNTLNIPEKQIPLCVIPIGYPNGKHNPKNKFNPDKITWNKFD